jgi:hypothetical protein
MDRDRGAFGLVIAHIRDPERLVGGLGEILRGERVDAGVAEQLRGLAGGVELVELQRRHLVVDRHHDVAAVDRGDAGDLGKFAVVHRADHGRRRRGHARREHDRAHAEHR